MKTVKWTWRETVALVGMVSGIGALLLEVIK